MMAKKSQSSKTRQAASPKAAKSKSPAKSTKRAGSRTSATNKSGAGKTPTSPRARSAKTASRTAAKNTARPKRPSRKSAKPAAARLRKTVDGYVSTLNDWRKDCVASLRKMIRQAAPKASEKVKWSQPVYEHHGPFAWIKAHTKHVNLGFWRGVELPDPRKLLKGTGEKMRHIKLSSIKDAGKKELQELVRLAAKLNELKGSPTRRAKEKAKHK